MIDSIIRWYKETPKELILDFDVTDDAVHGKHEDGF